jgi:hypothetical protein
MSRSISALLSSAAWEDLTAWLPHDLDALAAKSGGFQRRRAIQSPLEFLRLALAYGLLDLSLRSVAAWSADHGLGQLSDVAVLGRLRRGWPFLEAVFQAMLTRQVAARPVSDLPRRVRLVDATTLSAPGSTGADWRLHASYDLSTGTVDAVELTDGRGGEHLGRVPLAKGDLVVADRGYAHEARIRETLEIGADVLVRIGHRAVPLADANGEAFDPMKFATRRRSRAGRPPRVEGVVVYLRSDKQRVRPMRLVVVRKSVDATTRAQTTIHREAQRKGKQPTARTLAAARFAFLLTSIPASEADDATMAELYRLRWQIELAFKRWKSLLGIDQLRADDPNLARAYIYAKLIGVVLADTIARQWRAFSPYGVPIGDRPLACLE